jgi:hypothetical protein
MAERRGPFNTAVAGACRVQSVLARCGMTASDRTDRRQAAAARRAVSFTAACGYIGPGLEQTEYA